jgi:hypothetical protein
MLFLDGQLQVVVQHLREVLRTPARDPSPLGSALPQGGHEVPSPRTQGPRCCLLALLLQVVQGEDPTGTVVLTEEAALVQALGEEDGGQVLVSHPGLAGDHPCLHLIQGHPATGDQGVGHLVEVERPKSESSQVAVCLIQSLYRVLLSSPGEECLHGECLRVLCFSSTG